VSLNEVRAATLYGSEDKNRDNSAIFRYKYAPQIYNYSPNPNYPYLNRGTILYSKLVELSLFLFELSYKLAQQLK